MKRLALSVFITALAASSAFSQAKPKQGAVPAAAKTAFECACFYPALIFSGIVSAGFLLLTHGT